MHVDRLRFERPAGRRHYFADRAEGDTGVTVTVAGAEIQIDGVAEDLIRKVFDSDSFTLADICTWTPDVALEELVELLTELTRSGFLVARPLTTGRS